MINIDKLYESVEQKGIVCVGLDTDIGYIPDEFKKQYTTDAQSIVAFNKKIIDATKEVASCFKVQVAYYEALGIQGMLAYKETLSYLRKQKLISIADIKRGDIAKTAQMYAQAHFTGEFEADFITLNPYMGIDSITPYLSYCKEQGKGIFALVRTSNPGAKDFQYEDTANSGKFYDIVGDKLATLGENYKGDTGYSSIGMVIGGTHRDEASAIRSRYPHSFFLIPGYGAQGASANDIAQYLKDTNGGVVNASRSILLAYQTHTNLSFDEAAYTECIKMREDIQSACNLLKK